MENPFLDYIGCLAGGRLLCIDVKSMKATRLYLSESQRNSLLSWHSCGAACCIVWYRFDQCRIMWPEYLLALSFPGPFPVAWAELDQVNPGVGGMVFDWLENLRAKYAAT